MATGTNAIAVFNNLSQGIYSTYKSNNLNKAITNQELKDYSVYKYDSANLTRCVLYDSITTGFEINIPGINYISKTPTVTLENYLGKLTMVYACPYYSKSLGTSSTPSGNTFAISGLRSDVTLSATGEYNFTANTSECSGKFRVVANITNGNLLYVQIWRTSSVTISAGQYEHYVYKCEIPYQGININKTINGSIVSYRIPLYFAVKVYTPQS